MTLRVDGPAFRTTFAVALALLAGPARAQRITEFQIPDIHQGVEHPSGIAPGPDGAVWYGFFSAGGRVDRISPAGVITTFQQTSPGANPFHLAAGPDGAIWFTDAERQSIWQLTTAGQFTEFPLGVQAADITAGPDGALWFTWCCRGVGRLATDGGLTLYDDVYASYIVAGTDGALWTYGDAAAGPRLTRITTSGSVTEFPLPFASTIVTGFTAGPDGAFWFTKYSENAIGRVTTAGAYTEFALPNPASSPRDIASGPDGALWFTEYDGNRIGRITTAGAVTEVPIPTFDTGPLSITLGPDGNLWFLQVKPRTVARLDPTRPAGQSFFTVTPCRVVDTREPPGPRGGPALECLVRRDVNLTGVCGVPSGVVAVAANVTVVQPSQGGHLKGFAPAFNAPLTSLLNFAPGRERADNAILRLGPFGDLTLLCGMLSAGNIHVVIDVVGYFD